MNDIPKFIILYWLREKPKGPPTLKHSVFYTEDDLIAGIKNIRGNYNVFTVGAEYESMAYFQRLFDEEKIDQDRQTYERLKQRFEGNGETN